MKVVSYDSLTGDIAVRFAFSDAPRAIDDYPSHTVQVLDENGGADMARVLHALATTGWEIASQQQIVELQAADSARVSAYQALIGNEYRFTKDELFPPPPATCAAANQPNTTGLIEI